MLHLSYSPHTQMANSQACSLPPYTPLPARRTPLLAHRQSTMSFHPPTLHPPTTPLPATPSYAPPQYPAFQCPAPILRCHAEIIADVPAAGDPPTYAPAGAQAPQDELTSSPASQAAPPAHGTPPNIVALCLWRLERPMHLLPEGTCYLQISGQSRKNKIHLGTRIVCLNFRGWGVDRADRVRVTVRNWGEIGGKMVIQFATVPATAGVVKDDDTFYICFFHGFMSEDG